MAISAIRERIIRKTLTSRSLGRAADVFGRGMEKITFGHYRVGLSRTGMQISQQIKAGDKLKVTDGRVYSNGSLIYSDQKLFGGIRREVEVTPKMCTPGGMASALRWDIIGNAPEFSAAAISVASKLIFTGLYARANVDSMFDLGFYTMMVGAAVVPFHRLLKLFTDSHDRDIRLTNVEGYQVKPRYWTLPNGISGYAPFAKRGEVLINHNKKGADIGPCLAHEKSHILGASEYSAFRIMREKFIKSLVYERNGIKERLDSVWQNRETFTLALTDTLMSNTGVIIYAFMGQNLYREYFNEMPAKDKP